MAGIGKVNSPFFQNYITPFTPMLSYYPNAFIQSAWCSVGDLEQIFPRIEVDYNF